MTISKKLNHAISSIVVVVIVQAAAGFFIANTIHDSSQRQNTANDCLDHIRGVQGSAFRVMHAVGDSNQSSCCNHTEAVFAMRDISKGLAAIREADHPSQYVMALLPQVREMQISAGRMSSAIKSLGEKRATAATIREVKADASRLIKASDKSASLESSLIASESSKSRRLLIYFRLLLVIACSFITYAAVILIVHAKEISRNISALMISTERVVAGDLSERVKIDSGDDLSRLADSFNAMMIVLDISYEQAGHLTKESRERFIQMVTAFVKAIEAKDVYTRGHSENVAYYAVKICEAFEWPEEDIENMRVAALLHDIGKIGIREEVLNKTGKLTDEEYVHIKEHPEIARDILGSVPSLQGLANVAVHHHERYDGKGYPDGLEADDIPFGARILAVADAFDAMTSARTYKPAMPVDMALTQIEGNSGTQFDPMLAMVFVELVREGKIDMNELPEVA